MTWAACLVAFEPAYCSRTQLEIADDTVAVTVRGHSLTTRE